MLELRFPPPHRLDARDFNNLRRIIADALEVQRAKGNRAGNQAIIDGIGVAAQFVRDEGYWGEALDYHLGVLYANVGDPEKAAYHFDRSGTYPGAGGNQLFHEHQQNSLALRRQQELARDRGIPSLVIASMPRSASASLTQTLATTLDAPLMRVSCGQLTTYYLVPRWLNCFSPGGAVLHDHFGAEPFNMKTLRDGGVRRVFVRLRDPRSAAASMVNLLNRRFGAPDGVDYESQIVAMCEQSFIPWVMNWVAADADPENGVAVHWLTHPSSAVAEMARTVLTALADEYPGLQPYLRGNLAEVRANFVSGDEDDWRNGIGKSGQDRLWQAIPQKAKDLLALKP